MITSGYVQALALLAGVLDGAVLAMEDPGLSFHRDVVRHARAGVVALPVDERGARTDLLSTSGFTAARAVVVTPAHQYPTGVTLHPRRRHAATDWARPGDGLIIEDDYDGEFRYDRQPVGALQGMAPDHVAYVGTAAKTLGPGLAAGLDGAAATAAGRRGRRQAAHRPAHRGHRPTRPGRSDRQPRL